MTRYCSSCVPATGAVVGIRTFCSAIDSRAMPALSRRLGLWSAIGVAIGITIGGGIYRTPAVIATRVPDASAMLLVWVIGGLIVLCGALTIAELAAALPDTGGMYVYLREGWGRPVAFLYGWAQLVLIRAAALGGISSVFGEYALRVAGIDPVDARRLGRLPRRRRHPLRRHGQHRRRQPRRPVRVDLDGGQVRRAGSLLVAASFLLGGGAGATWSHLQAATGPVEAGMFGLALISVLWAYDGFADVSFASGEVKDPHRNLPRAILGGTLAIIAIYLSANLAYLYVNGLPRMQASRLVAADTMGALFGQAGAASIAVVVMISTFGSLMGSMLAGPRIFFALADDGLFFRRIAAVHPRFGTPHVAITTGDAARRGDGADADLRAADRHLRAGDVAVLCAERRGHLPASAGCGPTCRARTAPGATRCCRRCSSPAPSISSPTPWSPIRSGRRWCSASRWPAGRSTGWFRRRPDALERAALAAVDDDRRAADPAGPRRGEEGHDVADLLGAPEAAERQLGPDERGDALGVGLLALVPRPAGEQDRSRRHAVDPDVVRGPAAAPATWPG